MAKNTTKKTSKKPSAKPVPKASRAPVWEVLAGMLLAALTAAGIVSRQDGAKAREVLVKDFVVFRFFKPEFIFIVDHTFIFLRLKKIIREVCCFYILSASSWLFV